MSASTARELAAPAAVVASPVPAKNPARWAYAAVLAQTAIAVASSFVAKSTLVHVPPYALTLLRLLGATLIMGALLLLRGARPWRLPRADLASMALLGLFGMTLNQMLFLRGLAESTPGRSSLLYALTPLVVLFIGVSRGIETLSRQKLLGIACAFVGVFIVLFGQDRLAGAHMRGDIILMGGVIAWAAYSALGKPILARYDTFTVIGVSLFFSTLFLLPFALPELLAWNAAAAPARALWGVGYLVVFASVLAYLLWYYAIRHLPPSRVAIFMNLQPPAVVAVSWLTAHEPVTFLFLTGAALVLAGVRTAVLSR